MTDAGGDWGHGAHNGHKSGEHHGNRAEALEERIGALDVLDREQPGFLAFENRRPGLVADEIPDFTTDKCGDGNREADEPDVEADARIEREEPRDEQQCVAGQDEPDQQRGLGEHDEADHEQRPRARRRDDALRVKERQERSRRRRQRSEGGGRYDSGETQGVSRRRASTDAGLGSCDSLSTRLSDHV